MNSIFTKTLRIAPIIACMCCLSATTQLKAVDNTSTNLVDENRVLLYQYNENGSKYYRIPALVTAADGSLVCLADRRGSALGDLPNTISIVSKRSTDGGKTWSDMVVVAEGNSASGKTYGDPAVVLDRNTGNLIAVFCGDNGFYNYPNSSNIKQGVYMSKSSDNGLTWSAPTAITNQLTGVTWYGGFAGSGSMTQTADGTIYFVLNSRLTTQWAYSSVYEFVVASTDGGTTWKILNPTQRIPSDGLGNESKIAQLPDGSLLMSIRTSAANKKRRFSKSTDGKTWTAATENPHIIESGCNGDIIPYTTDQGQNVLLQSLPLDPAVRNKLGIYISFDNGQTWPAKTQLCDTYSAYSSMTILPDNTIGIVYEEGKWDSNIAGDDGFQLYFEKFSFDWLLENAEGDIPELPQTPQGPENPNAPATSLTFDGQSQYMIIPNSSDFNVDINGTLTVSIKANIKNSGDLGIIGNRVRDYTNKNNFNVSGWQIYNASSGYTTVTHNYPANSWTAMHCNAPLTSNNEWHHLVWVHNGAGKAQFYIDGNLATSATGSASMPMPSYADILVGAKFVMTDYVTFSYDQLHGYVKGDIGDIRIYKDAFTAADVAAERAAGTPLANRNLIAAYDFAEINPDNTVNDISGNGHTATLVNFPPLSDGIADIEQDRPDADERFFNLQGVEVAHPSAGNIYIRLSSGKASKILFR